MSNSFLDYDMQYASHGGICLCSLYMRCRCHCHCHYRFKPIILTLCVPLFPLCILFFVLSIDRIHSLYRSVLFCSVLFFSVQLYFVIGVSTINCRNYCTAVNPSNESNQIKANQTKPNQTKPNQIKSNQIRPNG